jgi:hypothetical protein
MKRMLTCVFFFILSIAGKAQPNELNNCNIVWDQQSKNAGESMPVAVVISV